MLFLYIFNQKIKKEAFECLKKLAYFCPHKRRHKIQSKRYLDQVKMPPAASDNNTHKVMTYYQE